MSNAAPGMSPPQGTRFEMTYSLKLGLAWLLAAATTAITGSVIQTQFSLAAIASVGAEVPFGLRLHMTLQDLAGFAPMFGGVAAAGFIVAFIAAALLCRLWPGRRGLLYTLAGAAAMLAALLLMSALLPVTGIGAARTPAGVLALTATGALGGWVFAAVAPRRRVA